MDAAGVHTLITEVQEKRKDRFERMEYFNAIMKGSSLKNSKNWVKISNEIYEGMDGKHNDNYKKLKTQWFCSM